MNRTDALAKPNAGIVSPVLDNAAVVNHFAQIVPHDHEWSHDVEVGRPKRQQFLEELGGCIRFGLESGDSI